MENMQHRIESAAQEAFGSMTPMVSKALKGATVGASVGLLLWMGRQLLPAPPPPAPFEELNEGANEALLFDPDVRAMCARMQAYQKLDEGSYTNFLLGWAQLVSLHVQLHRGELAGYMGAPGQCAKYAGIVVEAVRRMRAHVVAKMRNNPAIVTDFDDLAGSAQRRLNEYQHNIIKEVEYRRIC